MSGRLALSIIPSNWTVKADSEFTEIVSEAVLRVKKYQYIPPGIPIMRTSMSKAKSLARIEKFAKKSECIIYKRENMQSILERYISTFSLENTTTPAVISHDDALFIIEKWAGRDFGTIEKVKKDYVPGIFIYETPEDKVEFPISEVRKFITDTSKKPYE